MGRGWNLALGVPRADWRLGRPLASEELLHMNKYLTRLSTVVLCAMLAGCASGPASTSAGAMARIANDQSLTLGYREDARPFSYKAADGTPAGYTVELCKRVAASIQEQLKLPQLKVQWVPVTATNRVQAVQDGTVDLECGSTSRTLSREQAVDFSNSIWVETSSFVTQTSSGLLKAQDLHGKRLGFVPGTTTEEILKRLATRGIQPVVVKVASHTEGIAAVRAGSVDAYATDRLILIGEASSNRTGTPLRLSEDDLSIETYALMMRRDPAMRLVVNRALSQTYRSGEIAQIFRASFAPAQPSPLLQAVYLLNALPE